MIKRIINNVLILFFALSGCAGNGISFSVDKQSIVSCSGEGITKFRLSTDSQKYEFVLKKDGQSQKEIILTEIMNNYFIKISYPDSNNIIFKLQPTARYTFINQTVGDATEFDVVFYTDINSRIISADRSKCR